MDKAKITSIKVTISAGHLSDDARGHIRQLIDFSHFTKTGKVIFNVSCADFYSSQQLGEFINMKKEQVTYAENKYPSVYVAPR